MRAESVLVSQFNGDVKLLKINLSTLDAKIIPVDDINRDKVSFGMFEYQEGALGIEYVALLATPQGPLMFLNQLQFYPEIDKTRIKVEDSEQFSKFLLLQEYTPIFSFFYEKKFGIGLHPYSLTRDDIDFYYWLSRNIGNPKLYKTYTKGMKLYD